MGAAFLTAPLWSRPDTAAVNAFGPLAAPAPSLCYRRCRRAVVLSSADDEDDADWYTVIPSTRDSPPPPPADEVLDLGALDRGVRDSVGVVEEITVPAPGPGDEALYHPTLTFDLILVNKDVQRAVQLKCGFTRPTLVQAAAIPQIHSGRDIIIESHTGSGKTLAYLLPLLDLVDDDEDEDDGDDGDTGGENDGAYKTQLKDKPQRQSPPALMIAAPTRELAMQICRECETVTSFTAMRTLSLIGGANVAHQIEKLRKLRPHIVVGTPGRLLELSRGSKAALRLSNIQAVVLDEVDHALAPAFRKDLEDLLGRLPQERQTIAVSATASRPLVREFASKWLRSPALLRVAVEQALPPSISHYFTVLPRQKRLDAVRRIMYSKPEPGTVMCFVDNQRQSYIVAEKLVDLGISAVALSGEGDKVERANVLQATRQGKVKLIVCTEIAARGLDIPGVTHVVNLHLPTDSDHYVHRAGRCGRMGAPGKVVSVATPETQFVIGKITKPLGITAEAIQLREGKLVRGPAAPARSSRRPRPSPTESNVDRASNSPPGANRKAVGSTPRRAVRSERTTKKGRPGDDVTKQPRTRGVVRSERPVKKERAGDDVSDHPGTRRPRNLRRRAERERWVGNRGA